MRHPHGLRAAAAAAGLPAIGDAYGGGFYAGAISHTANGVATHFLIVAPAATGATGAGYTLTTAKQWKTNIAFTAGTGSIFDGAANTAAIVTNGIGLHPAAGFCVGLSIGGYTDWYLPAPLEFEIAYANLKPTTTSNNTSQGINAYSVPARTVSYTAGNPAQTAIAAFQSGGAEAFMVSNSHWSSFSSNFSARRVSFSDGVGTTSGTTTFTTSHFVRAFRKVAI